MGWINNLFHKRCLVDPPFGVSDASVALSAVAGGLSTSAALNVGQDERENRVHLYIAESQIVERAQLGFVFERGVWAKHRARGCDLQHPGMSAIELPVLLGDKPQRVAPITRLLRGSLDTLIQLPIGRIEHQLDQLVLAGHMCVQRHRAHLKPFGHIPHRERIHSLAVGNLNRGSHNRFQRQARAPGGNLRAPQQRQTPRRVCGLIFFWLHANVLQIVA
jgi:hypothetical protein